MKLCRAFALLLLMPALVYASTYVCGDATKIGLLRAGD